MGRAESFITECLRRKTADYLEVRLEDSQSTRVTLRGLNVDSVSETVLAGGCVRALVDGGWGFVSFNDPKTLEAKVAEAVALGRAASPRRRGRAPAGGESVRLAPCPAVRAGVSAPAVGKDARSIPLAAKVDLVRGYAKLAVESGPLIKTVQATYFDRSTRLTFANSEGTFITQEHLDLAGSVGVVAGRNGLTQFQACTFGSAGDYAAAEGLDGEVRETCDLARNLLDAPPPEGGEQTVVLDPGLTGIFIHEAFGHLSEADNVSGNPRLAEHMCLGRVLGGPELNVYDTGELDGVRGCLGYDDEGVAARRVDIIREGRLVGRLHSRGTAGRLGESPTGNARAITYRYPPIPRMRTTCVAPGEATLEELLRGVSRGLYARRALGGNTSGETFTFRPAEAYLIQDGRLGKLVRDVVLSGNVFDTLRDIDGIGRDFVLRDGPGGCGKGGQVGLAVSSGGPSLRVSRLTVGGARS